MPLGTTADPKHRRHDHEFSRIAQHSRRPDALIQSTPQTPPPLPRDQRLAVLHVRWRGPRAASGFLQWLTLTAYRRESRRASTLPSDHEPHVLLLYTLLASAMRSTLCLRYASRRYCLHVSGAFCPKFGHPPVPETMLAAPLTRSSLCWSRHVIQMRSALLQPSWVSWGSSMTPRHQVYFSGPRPQRLSHQAATYLGLDNLVPCTCVSLWLPSRGLLSKIWLALSVRIPRARSALPMLSQQSP